MLGDRQYLTAPLVLAYHGDPRSPKSVMFTDFRAQSRPHSYILGSEPNP